MNFCYEVYKKMLDFNNKKLTEYLKFMKANAFAI